MTVVSIYSTNDGMTSGNGRFNEQGGAVAIGRGTGGLYSINVLSDWAGPLVPPGPRPDGYTIVNRAELERIRDALTAELARQ